MAHARRTCRPAAHADPCAGLRSAVCGLRVPGGGGRSAGAGGRRAVGAGCRVAEGVRRVPEGGCRAAGGGGRVPGGGRGGLGGWGCRGWVAGRVKLGPLANRNARVPLSGFSESRPRAISGVVRRPVGPRTGLSCPTAGLAFSSALPVDSVWPGPASLLNRAGAVCCGSPVAGRGPPAWGAGGPEGVRRRGRGSTSGWHRRCRTTGERRRRRRGSCCRRRVRGRWRR